MVIQTVFLLKHEKLMQDTRAPDESGDSISLDLQEEEIPPTLISSSIMSHIPIDLTQRLLGLMQS